MTRIARAAALAAVLLLSGGCASSSLAWKSPVTTMSAVPTAAHPVAGGFTPSRPLIGAYEPTVPSWSGQATFTRATGITPKIVMYYSGWHQAFNRAFAQAARRHGAHVIVQMQPENVPLSSIVTGHSDEYLRSFARDVRGWGDTVILSFGHEMNGGWYSWGKGHESPAVFIAAWRHVVRIFRNSGATNVTWMWTVNAVNAADDRLRMWWPGTSYVDWVGIDGYYYRSTDSFDSVFGRTIAKIRQFSDAPVLIGETAVGVTPNRETQIAGLFAGAAAEHVIGVLWFDKTQDEGIFHQDWRLEHDTAALAAFTTAARTYMRG